jgi:capping protein alpha
VLALWLGGSLLGCQVEKATTTYAEDHYEKGVCSVYGSGSSVISCLEHHKFQPQNFWNGRWRSQWTLNTSTGELSGVLRVTVHYYEDGNVQLNSEKKVGLPSSASCIMWPFICQP